MIFVNTNLKIAIERNSNRERSIPEYVVQSNWDKVQQNIGAFQRMFSPNKMLIIDNNRSEQELVTSVLNTASKFIRSRLTNKTRK
jgi:thymidylate kinase